MPYGHIGYTGHYTYNSKVSVADSSVILSLDNIIMFSRGITVNTNLNANEILITLPSIDWAPANRTTIYVPVRENGVYTQKRLWIETNGTITTAESIGKGVIYMQSLMYNISGRYYNNTIGNTSGGTRPQNIR